MSLIQPRTLKGFRDYLPAVMIPREQMMQTARDVFRTFGFAPIDTPVLEYLEILSGKGSDETDRQIYRFQDNGGRDVGMRFDLTVPLARFSAQHVGKLGTPFKRYQIAPVWRGENPQAGRYREFVQCDFDTIGTESVLDAWWKLSGIFAGGMLGLFLLSMVARKATSPTAALGVIIGLLVITWMTFSDTEFMQDTLGLPFAIPEHLRSPLHTHMTIVVGTLTIFFVGLIASQFFGGAPRAEKLDTES